MDLKTYQKTALEWDAADPLASFKSRFLFPQSSEGKDLSYFSGNSLGLQPRGAYENVVQEMQDWSQLAVDGHFKEKTGWFSYHELVTPSLSRLVGARESEVVAMNTLTVNLHLMMVSFYQPTPTRAKILFLDTAFPSDRYAIESQIRFRGYNPSQTMVPVRAEGGQSGVTEENIIQALETHGSETALVLLENVNYLTGHAYDMAKLTKVAQEKGCRVGWDLAHGIGNLEFSLHDWNVDFAVWCSYKYLNGGPGCVAGCFVHERFHSSDLPRFAGWWGHNKATRFEMGPDFDPIQGAEGWQLSNPPILPLAALRASLKIFDEATLPALRKKSEKLTQFLYDGLVGLPKVQVLTPAKPEQRGCQLSVRIEGSDRSWVSRFHDEGIICDYREPHVFRFAPVPLYCGFADVAKLVSVIERWVR